MVLPGEEAIVVSVHTMTPVEDRNGPLFSIAKELFADFTLTHLPVLVEAKVARRESIQYNPLLLEKVRTYVKIQNHRESIKGVLREVIFEVSQD